MCACVCVCVCVCEMGGRGAQQSPLVSRSLGRHSTHLLGGIDDSSVVAKLQGAEHCPSHSQHEAARQLLQRENPTLLEARQAQVTRGQGLGWQVPLFR